MQTILWIPIGMVALGVLSGAMMGGRSLTMTARGGAVVGFYITLMFSLPLLAIGLANT